MAEYYDVYEDVLDSFEDLNNRVADQIEALSLSHQQHVIDYQRTMDYLLGRSREGEFRAVEETISVLHEWYTHRVEYGSERVFKKLRCCRDGYGHDLPL